MVASGLPPRYFCAKKSLCSVVAVGRWGEREISRVSPTFVKSAKRGQKTRRLSHIALNRPQSQKRHGYTLQPAQQMSNNCLHIKYFLCCSFHRKMGFLRFPTGAARRMDELTLPGRPRPAPNEGKGRCHRRDRGERARSIPGPIH